MELSHIIVILIGHFVADFLFQNSWMAKNKSQNNFPLFVHGLTYGLVLTLIVYSFIPTISFTTAIEFGVVSAILHFVVDYFTSKITSWQYKKGYMGSNAIPNIGFFSTIGFDQLIHNIMLFVVFTCMTV